MTTPLFRVYHKLEKRMYHFVQGWKQEYPGGPIIWTVWDDTTAPVKDWKTKTFADEEVIRMPFIGTYDDTLWKDLEEWEKEFWGIKGYSEINWVGKPKYTKDVMKLVCKGFEDKLEVVELDCHRVLCDSEGCVQHIPIDRSKCKIYLIGNTLQNENLLTDNVYHPIKVA